MLKRQLNRTLMLLAAGAALTACSAGPDYRRPEIDLPGQWSPKDDGSQSTSTTGERWWSLYADPVLDRLEEEALAHNADMQVALARVFEVRALLDVAGAAQYP
ncbi:MAG TPA: RND transporter, partial [Gallionella sp.]